MAHQLAAVRPVRPWARDDPGARRHRDGLAADLPLSPGRRGHYVPEGSLEYAIEGQPTKVYQAGEALTVPAGVIHAVRNVGTGTATELATYIIEKGKPVLTVAQ
jgi:hypothetical protein